MAKIAIALAFILLTGCSGLVKPTSGEKAVYKRYDITMPTRPELTVDTLTSSSTNGEATRAYELDLINMIQYSLQLENILAPIAKSEGSFDVQPTK